MVCLPYPQAFEDLPDNHRTFFPEPFLWYTFDNLVKVAAAMESGPQDSTWGYQIVHRDLKPGNSKLSINSTVLNLVEQLTTWIVFLGPEDERSEFPTYPVAKTGDWGLACKIKPDDHENPIGLRGAGTPDYLAPVSTLGIRSDTTLTLIKGAKTPSGCIKETDSDR